MKRFLLALFSTFLAFTPAMAQARLGDFTIRGAASQEMEAEGFSAAHPSLPLNSKVKVTNPRNGKEIEVTIVDRIDPSLNRIVDLSPAAVQALEIGAGEQVILTVAAPPRPVSHVSRREEPILELEEPVVQAPREAVIGERAVLSEQNDVNKQTLANEQTVAREQTVVSEQTAVKEQASAVEQAREKTGSPGVIAGERGPAVVSDNQNGQQPLNITVNTYVNEASVLKDASAAAGKQDNSSDFLAWLMTMALDARETRDTRDSRESRETRDTRDARERDAREIRDVRESREIRDAREAREAREAKAAANAQTQTVPSNIPTVQINKSVLPVEAVQPQTPSESTYKSMPSNAQPAAEIESAANGQPLANVQPLTGNEPAANSQPPAANGHSATNGQLAANGQSAANGGYHAANVQPVKEGEPEASSRSAALPPIPVRNAAPSAVYPPVVNEEDILIIPGLPDRFSGKIYRLQVGAYSAQGAANKASELMRAAGFDVEQEYTGSIYRVLAVGIASSDVYQASVRLGHLGFGQVWVRE